MSINHLPPDPGLFYRSMSHACPLSHILTTQNPALRPCPRRTTRKSLRERTHPTSLPQHIYQPLIVPAVIPAFWSPDSNVSLPTGLVFSCATYRQSCESVYSRSSRSRVLNRPLERYHRGIEAMLFDIRDKKDEAVARQQQGMGHLTTLRHAREALGSELDSKEDPRSPPMHLGEGVEEVGPSRTAFQASPIMSHIRNRQLRL